MDYRKFFISLALLALTTFGLIIFITYTFNDYTPESTITTLFITILKMLFLGLVIIAHLYLTYLALLFFYSLLRKSLHFISTTLRRMYHTILK